MAYRNLPAMLPQWGQLMPLHDGARPGQFRLPPPPAPTNELYTRTTTR
jgi:hypothetical protein